MVDNVKLLIDRFELFLDEIEKNKNIRGKIQVLKDIRYYINNNINSLRFLSPPIKVRYKLVDMKKEDKGIFKGIDSKTGFFVFGTDGRGDIMYNSNQIIYIDYNID